MTIDRFALAERQLDRMQSFHGRIDAKVAAVSAWLLLELGVVAANTRLSDLALAPVWISLTAFLICVSVSGVGLWRCLFPDQRGGAASLIYFARIADRTEAGYLRDFQAASDQQLYEDVLGQVWRNAEIVCDKYRFVSLAIRWATFSLGVLVVELIAVSWVHRTLPLLKA